MFCAFVCGAVTMGDYITRAETRGRQRGGANAVRGRARDDLEKVALMSLLQSHKPRKILTDPFAQAMKLFRKFFRISRTCV